MVWKRHRYMFGDKTEMECSKVQGRVALYVMTCETVVRCRDNDEKSMMKKLLESSGADGHRARKV